MDKQVQYCGKTASGTFCQALFGSAGVFEKVAGAPAFADWETGDELRKFIKKLSKEDRKKNSYVLVNALGAGEYFGSNINADFFPWNALTHKGTDYGYKTFEHFAHAFQHHKNKDPTRAFGIPELSILNMPMKRVELIIRLDRAKAKEEQADGIITRIDKGEFPDVSMGCKVPYDICSICQQKSKTRFDYCEHMMPPEDLRGIYGPNKILSDGRKIYVINTLPKFFDISFVFIGADKTAKVMAKVASRQNQICFGDICTLESMEKVALRFRPIPYEKGTPEYETELKRYHEIAAKDKSQAPKQKAASACCDDCDGNEKLAEAFGTTKLSEMVKRVPVGGFVSKVLPSMTAKEPSIPTATLNALATNHSLGEITGGALAIGIVLKPAEFQRIVLVRMGNGDFADRLDTQHSTFAPGTSLDSLINPDPSLLSPSVLQLLRSYIGARSGLGQSLVLRELREKTAKAGKIPLPTPSFIDHPLLNKISAAYNGYRRNLLTKLSQVERVIHSDPSLREEILGTSLSGLFSKTAASSVFSHNSMEYMMGAYITNKDLMITPAAVNAMAGFTA